MKYHAHSLPGRPRHEWETMEEHLHAVSSQCSAFADAFASAEWGQLAGLWHDLGKFSEQFQQYLAKTAESDVHAAELRGTVDHATGGAQWAVQSYNARGTILAHVIAGHHSGLLNYHGELSTACLKNRLTKEVAPWQQNAPAELLKRPCPSPPDLGKVDGHAHAAFRVAFWIRMLFSALVDADYLATEAVLNPLAAKQRAATFPSMQSMLETLDAYMADLTARARARPTPVNQKRADVLAACRSAAEDRPGFFDLCVPTGGGKTLASMAFALKHADRHKMRRIIVAVPFTSIIDQHAKVYHDVFSALGDDVVLEHHSNLDPDMATDRTRLQSENWDAPLVVTTNVQLFESLFACRTSRCRKLHRIVNSVIILDEAQALPVELLKPTLWALRELVERYGCTVVLSSATQPALSRRADFKIGLEGVRPIIGDPAPLYEAMRRVEVLNEGCLDDDQLQERLLASDQALCVVNTRPHAARLFELLGEADGHYHLSTRMCGAHRKTTLDQIAERLQEEKICRVVSTQLVEAGVDLDFPAVFRARCGLDSLVQAAGRCNREGRRKTGQVVFFAAADPPPPGHLRQTADVAEELMSRQPDLLAPAIITEYFKMHYWLNEAKWDQHRVLEAAGNQPNRMRFDFRDMAERYRLIRDVTEAVLVPWESEGAQLIERLRAAYMPDRRLLRKLQRYAVNLRPRELDRLKRAGAVEHLEEQQQWVLIQPDLYEKRLGLRLDKADECGIFIA